MSIKSLKQGYAYQLITVMFPILILLPLTKAFVKTVEDFPFVETYKPPIQHHVSVSSVPYNSSEGQNPFICYNSESCQVISSRVTTKQKRSLDGCDHQLFMSAFDQNLTLCLNELDLRREPIFGLDFDLLNVTVFSHDNNSQDLSLASLDLHLASGYVLEEAFASVSGFILDGHFYGTLFLKDAVQFLEPMGRETKDMHILGDGLRTLLRR